VKYLRSVVIGAVIVCAWSAPVGATTPTEPPTEPSTTVVADVIGPQVPVLETPPPIVDPLLASTPLVVVPAGCNTPPPPLAVFVGTLAAADTTTARFAVEQVRAGSLDGYAVNTIVDVRYDDDIRFLHTGRQYLVGARPDRIRGVLSSKVRVAAPLFGGDAVIGIDDKSIRCPRVEDGVKTLLPNGTEVDTGVLAPLKTAKRSIAKAILKPMGIAFGVLFILVAVKLLIFAMVRAAREREPEPRAVEVQRERQHIDINSDDAYGGPSRRPVDESSAREHV
jgi:hypothetical protein